MRLDHERVFSLRYSGPSCLALVMMRDLGLRMEVMKAGIDIPANS